MSLSARPTAPALAVTFSLVLLACASSDSQPRTCGSDACDASCACATGKLCGSTGQCTAVQTLTYDPANGHSDNNPDIRFTYPLITGSTGNTTVGLNIWSSIDGMTERVDIVDPGHWEMYVKANNPPNNILLFTNTGQNYDEPLLSSFSSITSAFDDTLPPASSGARGWNAYDLWLNNWHDEVMIQTHWINDTGCDTFLATATFGGSNGVPINTWALCRFGDESIWQLNSAKGPDATSLTVDLKAMMQWLVDHGYITTSASTITAISFGFEVSDTKGVEVGPWKVNAFSATLR